MGILKIVTACTAHITTAPHCYSTCGKQQEIPIFLGNGLEVVFVF